MNKKYHRSLTLILSTLEYLEITKFITGGMEDRFRFYTVYNLLFERVVDQIDPSCRLFSCSMFTFIGPKTAIFIFGSYSFLSDLSSANILSSFTFFFYCDVANSNILY